jgi:SPX domain protein involved in polyphosphate accumulation
MEQRLERKYIINKNISSTDFVNLFNGYFKETYKERIVNSIYFDNPEYHNFFDNVEGNQNRFKVRIRWYGDDIKNSKLEIKVKEGLFGKKIITEIQNISTTSDFYQIIKNPKNYPDLDTSYIPYVINLIPTSYNNYLRRYFESFDGKIRVTVDSNLKFKKLYNFKLPKDKELLDFDYSIIEVKYKSSDEYLVSKIMRNSPLILRKFSKYTAGVLAN